MARRKAAKSEEYTPTVKVRKKDWPRGAVLLITEEEWPTHKALGYTKVKPPKEA